MDFKLRSVGIEQYNYFDAIDGKTIEEYEDYKNFCKQHNKRVLQGGAGAYGCLKSFTKLFNTTQKAGLILEDDVYFHKNFQAILSDIQFDSYDMIYFGYNNYHLSHQQNIAIKNNTNLPVSNDRRFTTCGAFAIWYSAKAIDLIKQQLNAMTFDSTVPLDHITWYVASIVKSIIINPPLCIAELRHSYIRDSRDMNEFYTKRMIDLSQYNHLDKYDDFLA